MSLYEIQHLCVNQLGTIEPVIEIETFLMTINFYNQT